MDRSDKPPLHVLVGHARHFVQWELPILRRYFRLVKEPAPDVVLYAFGSDVLKSAAYYPALARFISLFPGFGVDPYHDLRYREEVGPLLEARFATVFVNPGPLEVAFAALSKLAVVQFSIDVDKFRRYQPRRTLDSLLHVSADYAHKDWRRSLQVMAQTGLRHEVFPPRRVGGALQSLGAVERFKRHANRRVRKLSGGSAFRTGT